MEELTIDQVKALYPDEWVLMRIEDKAENAPVDRGIVLFHGKDYLELCYKGSEIAKKYLTTILFTGTTNSNRKWLKNRHANRTFIPTQNQTAQPKSSQTNLQSPLPFGGRIFSLTADKTGYATRWSSGTRRQMTRTISIHCVAMLSEINSLCKNVSEA